MAVIKAFECIRPDEKVADRVAALPYDVYNREEALKEVEREPLSFLAIDRAETQFDSSVDTYADCVYDKARELLDSRIADGTFITDTDKAYYVYELTMNGRTQTGPIFLAYRADEVIRNEVAKAKETKPLYSFTSPDGIRHQVYKISNAQSVENIEKAFAGIDDIYIADGHHRAASAVKVGLKRREEHPDYTGEEEFNYFLSVLFPDEELMIMPYNRVAKDINGYSKEEFIKKIEEKFEIEESAAAVEPAYKAEFGMYLDEKWYKLKAKKDILSDDPVDGLDVAILQNNLLEPVLGIHDPKTDKRIDFVGGIRGLLELEKRCHTDCVLAFSMYPTSIAELFAVADAGRLMPPKSTWFEPKLRSGLFIHKIEE